MTTFNAAFWKWFGKSKVVDAQGKPLVVYHQTISPKSIQRGKLPFTTFMTSDAEMGAHFGTRKQAYQVGHPRDGHKYLFACYLRIVNPLRLVDHGDFDPTHIWSQLSGMGFSVADLDYEEVSVLELQRVIQKEGYDGIVYLNRREGISELPPELDESEQFTDKEFLEYAPHAQDSWIAFYPQQIKLVSNRGTWSPSDPDIRHNPDKPRVVCAGLVVIEYFDGQFHIMLPTGTVWMRPTAKQAEAFAKKWAKAHMQKGAVNVLRIDWRGEAAGLARKAGIQG